MIRGTLQKVPPMDLQVLIVNNAFDLMSLLFTERLQNHVDILVAILQCSSTGESMNFGSGVVTDI